MDVVQRFAVEIARQTVPDEIYQASLVAENFIKGGRARKELLRQARSGELGGFGATEAAVLAWIFQAMTVAAPFLAGFLASKTIENSGIIIRAIHSALNTRTPTSEKLAQAKEQIARPDAASELAQQRDIVPEQLQQCVDAMAKVLQNGGFPPGESKSVAYKVMLVLWEDAPDALVFLHKIGGKK